MNDPFNSPLEGYTQNQLNSKPKNLEKKDYIKFFLELNKERIGKTITLKQTNNENIDFIEDQKISCNLQAMAKTLEAQRKAANLEEQEKRQKAKEEESYNHLKEEYNQMKATLIEDLQKTAGLTTKECRQAVLLELIIDYNHLKNKVCHVSNYRLLERLQEFGFEISERTLQNDLGELKAKGLIKVKIFKEVYQGQYKSQRHIRQSEETINTFFQVEVIMDSINYFLKNTYNKVSNKLKAAKTYLQEGLKRLNKVAEMKKLKKRTGTGIPFDLGEVVSYFIEELRKPASKAVDFYNWYSKNNWYDAGGKPINSWRGIAKVWG